jgi:hypothetical protein
MFFMTAGPVSAAFWDNWNFGNIIDYFSPRNNQNANNPSDNPRGFGWINRDATNSARPTGSRIRKDEVQPTDFIRPTGFIRPTRIIKPPKIENTRGANTDTGTPSSQWEDAINNRIKNTQDITNRIFDTYEKRLSNYNDFLNKVKSRRDKLAAEGKDVSKLDSFILTASNNLNTELNLFNTVNTDLASLDYTGDIASLRQNIHNEFTKLHQAMTTLHNSMKDTVSEIVAKSSDITITPRPTWETNDNRDNSTGSGRGNSRNNPNQRGGRQ